MYRVSIDVEACVSCGTCEKVCPSLAITKKCYTEKGVPLHSCTKCGECIDSCPKSAISYGFRSKKKYPLPNTILGEILSPKSLFPFTAFTFGCIISSGFATSTIHMVLRAIMGAS